MTRDQALERARTIALEHCWMWIEPVRAVRVRPWLVGRPIWEVTSNAGSRGCNVRVVFDDETGLVRYKGFAQR